MFSCAIDAIEYRDVSTTNISIAFLQTDMEGTVQVRLDIVIAEMLLKFYSEKYGNKVIIKQGKKVIYTVLKISL